MNETHALTDKELLDSLSFCVFDLETTGGNHDVDQIIEIGLVRVQNQKIVAEKHLMVKPEIEIPIFIQRLTSISPSDMKDAKKIEEVIDDILEFMGDSILVAHNVSFDVPFFNSVLRRLGKPTLTNKSLCTVLMTKYLIPDLLNSNLNYMSKIFGIEHAKAHRALDDTKATAELLLNYLQIFANKGINKINHLYYPRNRYELDRVNIEVKEGVDAICKKLAQVKTPYLLTVKGENGIILFTLPGKKLADEEAFIKKTLSSMKWELATIRIFGSFLEAFVHFNSYFGKLDAAVKNLIMQYLWKAHFNCSPQNQILAEEKDDTPLPGPADYGDFVVIPHLIPEQYAIFPMLAMHPKSELVFRYPSHKKKLIQYIASKSSKLSAGKVKKTFFPPMIVPFLNRYISHGEQNPETADIYVFKKTLPLKKEAEFVAKLESFLKRSSFQSNYPREYL